MKFVIYPFKPFELKKDSLTILETDNYSFFRNLILNFNNDSEKIFVTNNDNVIKKGYIWLADPIINNQLDNLFKIKMQDQIINFISEEQINKLILLDEEIKSIFLNASYNFEYPLVIDHDLDLKKLYKYIGFKLDDIAKNSPYDIISITLNMLSIFESDKLIVLTNLLNYFDDSELKEIKLLIESLNLNVLILNFSNNKRHIIEECRHYFIDQDFVDWR